MCTTVAAQVLECASMRFDGMSENGKKDESVTWECRSCGHLVTGAEAPQTCPVCGYQQAYFQEHTK